MLKKIATYLFVLFIAGPSLINAAALIDYGVRYQKYVEELCENKDVPELACNGKCHLSKLQQKQDPVQPEVQLNHFDIEMIASSTMGLAVQALPQKQNLGGVYPNQFLSTGILAIDVPPPRG